VTEIADDRLWFRGLDAHLTKTGDQITTRIELGTNSDSYGNSYIYTHGNGDTYTYGNSEADAYAEISAYTEASSDCGASPVESIGMQRTARSSKLRAFG